MLEIAAYAIGHASPAAKEKTTNARVAIQILDF